MKKKIVAALFTALMSVTIFTGCGKSAQGDGDTQAAMATVESDQGESSDVPVSGVETIDRQTDTKPEIAAVASNDSADIEAEQRAAEQARAASGYKGAGAADEGVKDTATATTAQSQATTGSTAAAATSQATTGSTAAAATSQTTTETVAVAAATTAQTTNTEAAGSRSSGTSKEFIDLLNAKRAEMGLNPIEWDSTLAAEASKRAQEITTNFSHDGMSYSENLFSGNTGDINDWFEGWWNSEGHRITMMRDYFDKGACSFVEIDGQYYVVLVVDGKKPVASAEEWQAEKEQGLADGTLHELKDKDGNVVGYGTEGVSVVTDPEVLEMVNSWDW